MSLLADEHVASLVLLWLVRDAKEGWDKWGQLAFVNKAWRNVFSTNKIQLLEYRLHHMYHLLQERNKQLHIFRIMCSCRVEWPSAWSDEGEAGSPPTSPEY
jgi:hypothetical protein